MEYKILEKNEKEKTIDIMYTDNVKYENKDDLEFQIFCLWQEIEEKEKIELIDCIDESIEKDKIYCTYIYESLFERIN